nr:S8 family peptidase [Acetatifactor sp.]
SDCFPLVTMRPPFLNGNGVLIAVLDSGIAYERREFRTAEGNTRIRYLWDQTLEREFSQEQINEALRAESMEERFTIVPSVDVSGHGTAVAGLAAGYSEQDGYYGAATAADLLIVKLGLPSESGFPRTVEIMRGVTYALQKAEELEMPLVINLSFGNSYGAHNGTALLERFLDDASGIGRTVICVGSGNEGSAAGHFAGNIEESRQIELSIAEYERSMSVQFWQNYSDSYRIVLRSPGGEEAELTAPAGESFTGGRAYTLRLEQTEVYVYQGMPTPYSTSQELYLEMIPAAGQYINRGIWSFQLEPLRVVTGDFYLYLPAAAGRNARSVFLNPTPQVTLTIPSTASRVITVGAYDPYYFAYADFSGRGYINAGENVGTVGAGDVKPDLVAPGVGVRAVDALGGYTAVTGTSFATPIVSGGAALLMEWGIVRENNPFLYGEKMKAYLRRGARPLRGEERYPNERVGFGALCVSDSILLTL